MILTSSEYKTLVTEYKQKTPDAYLFKYFVKINQELKDAAFCGSKVPFITCPDSDFEKVVKEELNKAGWYIKFKADNYWILTDSPPFKEKVAKLFK